MNNDTNKDKVSNQNDSTKPKDPKRTDAQAPTAERPYEAPALQPLGTLDELTHYGSGG